MAEKTSEKVCDIIPMTVKNYRQMMVINKTVLPVSYSDDFYQEIINDKNVLPFCKYAIFDMDLVVGSVMCRHEQKADGKTAYYIMTIGVLPPYTHLGIGSELLRAVVENAKQDKACDEVYLHVWVDNKAAFDFYTKKNGFTQKATIENYYHDLEHPHAHVLSLAITHE